MRRRLAVGGAAVVLVGAVASTARADDDDRDRYRVATAVVGDVEQTLSLAGTVGHARTSELSFATEGTVRSVYVEEGRRVRRGQRLAALDTAALDAAVVEANAALAQARAQLESDLEAQEDAVEDTTEPMQPDTPPQPQPPQQPEQPQQPESPDPALADALAQLAAQQQAVLEAQSAATGSLAVATAALAAQQSACEVPESQDCADALVAVQRAQADVATAQEELQQVIGTLAATLTKAIEALAADSPVVPAVALTADPPAQDDGSPTSTPTAATIADDQAAVDEAEAALVTAQQQRKAAVLRATHDGIVETIDVSRGQRVAPGSPLLTLRGQGRTTVATSAGAQAVGDLAKGQAVGVRLLGQDRVLRGRVTAIGLLPSDDGTYPVTVTLRGGADLPTGSAATLSVVVDTASDVVTLPASAVSDGAVQVLEDGRIATHQVSVGAVGSTTLEVTGISAGTTVVLADASRDLPTEDSSFPGLGGGGPAFRIDGPAGGGGPVVRTFPG